GHWAGGRGDPWSRPRRPESWRRRGAGGELPRALRGGL
ncbi:MAG: hypothetical protein AVDCRST_MAG05-269, partial [uncultured Rubrobacteraceae bacterium]